MWQFKIFVLHHFDNILMMCLWFILFCTAAIHRSSQKLDSYICEGSAPPDVSVNHRALTRQVIHFTAVLAAATALMLATHFVQNLRIMLGLFCVVLFLLICFHIHFVRKNGEIVTLHSDIRDSIPLMLSGAFFVGMIPLICRLTSILPTPSWCIPLIYRLLCFWNLWSLYHLSRTDRSDIPLLVSAQIRIIVMCHYAWYTVMLWVTAGYFSSLQFATMPMTIVDWLRGVFLFSNSLYAIAVRISAFVVLILLVIPVIHITRHALKETMGRNRQLKLLIPAALTVTALGSLWLVITGYPASGKEAYSPIIPDESNTTYLSDSKSSTLPVLQNGTDLRINPTVFIDGVSADFTLVVLNDFSDCPYFRYYAKPVDSSTFSVWVENQGGIAAEACTFELSAEERGLSAYYPKELLHTCIDTLEPGEHRQLFLLPSADLLRTEYDHIPLTLNVQSSSTFNGVTQNLVQGIPGDTYLTMNGLALEPGYDLWVDGLPMSKEFPLLWCQPLLSYDNQINDFQTSQTVLAELLVSVTHETGGITHLESFRFICETP